MGWRDRLAQFLAPSAKQPASAEPERLAPVETIGSVAWAEISQLLADAKYNPDDLMGRKGMLIYNKMMFDEQVKSVMYFKRSTVTGREFYFHLDAEKAGVTQKEADHRVDVMTTAVNQGYCGPFVDGLNCVMKAMWQGFSITEQMFGNFQYDGKTWWCLRDLRTKPFHSFYPIVNDKGDVQYWEQRYGSKAKSIRLDMNKFVYYRFNPDVDEHFGGSDLRAAYRAFLSKDIAIRYRNIFLERMAGGFVVTKPTEGNTIERNSPEWNALTEILKNIKSTSGVILPAGVDMNILYASGGQFDVFDKAIDKDDLAIAKAALVPNLIGMTPSGQTGSYSQSDTQFDVFMIVSDTEASRLEDALNEQVFMPLARQNFGDDGALPRFCFKPLSKRKTQQLLGMWKDLLTAKGVQASLSDEQHVRKLLEFPEKDDANLLVDPAQEAALAAAPTGRASPSSSSPSEEGDGEDGDGERRPSPPGRGEKSEENRDKREGYRRKRFHGDPDDPNYPHGGGRAGQERDPSGRWTTSGMSERLADHVDREKSDPKLGPKDPKERLAWALQSVVDATDDERVKPKDRSEAQRVLRQIKDGTYKASRAFNRAERRVAFAVIQKQTDADMARAVLAVDLALGDVVQDGLDRFDFQNTEARHFDLDAMLTRKVQTEVHRMLKQGMDLGAEHARREMERAKRSTAFTRRLDMKRLGDLAAEWMKNKSFNITGDLRASAVREIKTALVNGLKLDKTEKQIKVDIYERLARKGVLSGRTVKEALREGDLGTLAEQLEDIEGLTPHHLNTVIRTNMFEAINEGRFNAFTDPELEGFVVGFEYSAVLDERTTGVCEHMNGKVYSSERWQDDLRPWVPPNHFNCRSLLVPVTVNDETDMDEELPDIEPQEGFG